MMLAQQIDMQWYCVELARSFNDLSTVIANGDYLHAGICFNNTSDFRRSQPAAADAGCSGCGAYPNTRLTW
jgi:hypothetical protein